MANKLIIDGARFAYRTNFSGTPSEYNKSGKRTFNIEITDAEMAAALEEDGWNIKRKPSKRNPEEDIITLQVEARFDNFPPKVVLVTSLGKTILDEDTIGQLDTAEISNVDLEINPSTWNVNGRSGIKAYLKTMYVTIEEDSFYRKYYAPEDEE